MSSVPPEAPTPRYSSGAPSAPGDESAAEPRHLMRALGAAALGTTMDGAPYVSLVLCACEGGASPLLMMSDLAQHTRNVAADPRASLLFDGTGGLGDPLAGARLTVMGRVDRCEDPRALDRYLARHPSAAAYAGFGDFKLYRLNLEGGHFVAGFGRIGWIPPEDLRSDGAAVLAEAEPDIVAHMNEDHAAAVDLYAQVLLGRAEKGWRMTGIDPDGADLRLGGEVVRLPFDTPVLNPEQARAALVQLAREARSRRLSA